eukprot:m.121565 g.121565  ORF g.121565 m.121565 type:complete len:412 (+) comp19629_c0_seq2:56-1291(+)
METEEERRQRRRAERAARRAQREQEAAASASGEAISTQPRPSGQRSRARVASDAAAAPQPATSQAAPVEPDLPGWADLEVPLEDTVLGRPPPSALATMDAGNRSALWRPAVAPEGRPAQHFFSEEAHAFRPVSLHELQEKERARQQHRMLARADKPAFDVRFAENLRTCFTLCHGLLSGVALCHIVVVQDLPDDDAEFLAMYSRVALDVATVFQFMSVWCMVGAATRLEQSMVTFAGRLPLIVCALLAYLLVLVMTVVLAKTDVRMEYYEHDPQAWTSLSSVHEWRAAASARAVFCLVAWLFLLFDDYLARGQPHGGGGGGWAHTELNNSVQPFSQAPPAALGPHTQPLHSTTAFPMGASYPGQAHSNTLLQSNRLAPHWNSGSQPAAPADSFHSSWSAPPPAQRPPWSRA